jgi:fatty-acyl-CoA synthase
MSEAVSALATKNRSTAKSWARALEMTAPIPKNPGRVFPDVIDDLAERLGNAPALLSDAECLTYRALAERSNQYARWALSQGLVKGDVVCLLMPNRPEYLVIWLGIIRAHGIVSLLNTNLTGISLAHCINIAEPTHMIVASELFDSFTAAQPMLTCSPKICVSGSGIIEQYSGAPLSSSERRPLSILDTALYIYTSGTTGLPKAAKVSHFRLMQWSHWFAGMMAIGPTDVMYNCLPMYHSVGGVVAAGALLAGGGSVVIRDKFSASRFWDDIARWDCSLFQYIGELCRYLLHTEPSPHETNHRIRMCCGNGLRLDVWTDFQKRFRIPEILEFYAATEGNVSLFNVDGKPGSIGRIPSFLAHRFAVNLVKFEVEEEMPIRDERGFCIPCAPAEIGEAIGRISTDPANPGGHFEGYTNQEASEKKILRNVFKPGDAWFRTGDLMRKDEKGYYYFVDRVGDTFRWKGENVATSEVSEAISAFPGIREANVFGVAVPGAEGRAGMAAIAVDRKLNLEAFWTHLTSCLPSYARPLFLRIQSEFQVTATFKHTKNDLVREGYDPAATPDRIYFNDAERHTFVPIDNEVYNRIKTGLIRF